MSQSTQKQLFSEFNYSPFCSKEDIDRIDVAQTITKFTSKVEKVVYKEENPDDFIDLHKNFKDKVNKGKAKWTLDVSLMVYEIHKITIQTNQY